MNIFYEEQGAFKMAKIESDKGGSYNVTTQHGKTAKVKASNVFFTFDEDFASFQAALDKALPEFDISFIWEVAEPETDIESLAKEYFGRTPTKPELAGLLQIIYANPVYFYKKGKGQFKKAEEEVLKKALATIELKRQENLHIEEMTAELVAGKLPKEVEEAMDMIMFKPVKLDPAYKAFQAATQTLKTSPLQLARKLGFYKDYPEYAMRKFLYDNFPEGTGFGDVEVPKIPMEIPRNEAVKAFSIDNDSTTEIDDAISVRFQSNGSKLVGVHISAVSAAMGVDTPLEEEVFERMSTVYYPTGKITMLPKEVIDVYSLDENSWRPALSIYFNVDDQGDFTLDKCLLEEVWIDKNLRTPGLQDLYSQENIAADAIPDNSPFKKEILWLHEWSKTLRVKRGKDPEEEIKYDFNIAVDEDGFVKIDKRRRNDPIDSIVGELMILANSAWAKMLSDENTSGVFRAHLGMGNVKMTTQAEPHKVLGVDHYAWFTSPLRRAVDYVNQRQLLHIIHGKNFPLRFQNNEANLFAFMKRFESIYSSYRDFQDKLEDYYCMKWLRQEGKEEVVAILVKEGIARLEDVPISGEVNGIPFGMLPKTRIRCRISEMDMEVEAKIYLQYLDVAPKEEA